MTTEHPWLDQIVWSQDGLVPAIAQDHTSSEVLMVAWMNHDALLQTVASGKVIYYSRSRKKLWHKGEISGHWQRLVELRLDCDGDVILLKVEQIGGIACHTGRANCFYRTWSNNEWVISDPVLKNPELIYE